VTVWVRVAEASSAATTPVRLEELARDSPLVVRAVVADNPHAPARSSGSRTIPESRLPLELQEWPYTASGYRAIPLRIVSVLVHVWRLAGRTPSERERVSVEVLGCVWTHSLRHRRPRRAASLDFGSDDESEPYR
jgi:hypothetical protein